MRYLFHRSYFLRTLALIEVSVSACIAIGFNLLVGHYRDALGGDDPMHASAAALNGFTNQPFNLGAFQSWVLFAMGLFFWIVAAFDGFKMDDSYPGYGKISRKHEEITQDYNDEKANIVDDLSVTRDHALDYIREARQSLSARRSELSSVLDHREKLIQMFDTHQSYLERAANELLALYRNSNLNARSAPAPAHFNRGYTLPKAAGVPPLPHAVNAAFLDANIEKTDAALREAVNQVNTQFEGAVGAFHQIGDLNKAGGDNVVHATAS